MPSLTPVSFLARFMAWFYDLLLLSALLLMISAIFVLLNGGDALAKHQPIFYLYQCSLALVISTYFIGFWVFTGQTTGMRAWKLYLLNAQQQPVTFKQAGLRFFWALVTPGLGIFWAWVDKQKYPLYERLSNTYVFKQEKN